MDYVTDLDPSFLDYTLSGFSLKKKAFLNSTIFLEFLSSTVESNLNNALNKITYSYAISGNPVESMAYKAVYSKSKIMNENININIPEEALESYNLELGYFAKKFNINARSIYTGERFGPETSSNHPSGQRNQSIYFTYNFSPDLYYYYNFYQYQTLPFIDLPISSFFLDMQFHKLNWKLPNDFNLAFGIENYKNNTSSTSSYNSSLEKVFDTSFTKKFKKLNIMGDLKLKTRNDTSNNVGYARQRVLNLNYSFNKYNSIFFQYNNSMQNIGASSTRQNNYGIGFRNKFKKNKGEIEFNYGIYNDLNFFAPQPAFNSFIDTLYLKYEIFPRLILSGNYYSYKGLENQHDFMNYSVNLTFLVNKNAQLIAEYRYNPLNIVYFDINQPLDLGKVFSVQLKQSFGGSFEKIIQRKWNGKIIIKMLYKSANENDKKIYDLKKVRVSIDGEIFSETNDEGEAYFEDIPPGKHKIKIYVKEIGANFVPFGKTNLEINLNPSETKEISFLFKAYSSIYAIVWNDVDNSHKIPQAYFGFSNLKIDLIAPDNIITNMFTSDDGTAYFKKIIPGKYKISVLKGSIPEGMISTTPLSLDLELSPGDEKIIGFGIKGYGEITGKVSLVKIGAQNVFEPFSDIKIKMDGMVIGASDEKGEFLITVPAGGHIFEPGYSVEYYLIDEKIEKIMILPAKKAAQEYKLAKYGKVIGKINFKDNVSLKQFSKESIVIILKGAQGEEEFVYTDKNGDFIFNNLKMGKYKIILDKSYIPEGLKISSPLINEVVINSGDVVKVNYIFDLK